VAWSTASDFIELDDDNNKGQYWFNKSKEIYKRKKIAEFEGNNSLQIWEYKSERKFADGLCREVALGDATGKNHHDFICQGKVDSTTRSSEHLMKRAIALSIQNKVFYPFLLNNPNPDVNAIEWVIEDPEAAKNRSAHLKLLYYPHTISR
jgi:hypothetical protein